MSQHDFNILNQTFPDTRADLNLALAALASNSSGDTEPSTTYANQWWYETDTNILKIRNEANDGWVDVITLDASMTATASELNQLDAITRGSILYGNASGATARLAAGGADTVLTSDGTDLSWTAPAAGGAYNLLQTVTASDDATVSVGSSSLLTTAYSVYEIHVTGLIPASDTQTLRGRVEIGGSIMTTHGYYDSFAFNTQSGTTAVTGMVSGSGVSYSNIVQNMENASSGAVNFVLRFYNPASTTLLKTWDYFGSAKDTDLTRIRFIAGGAGYTNGTAALSGFNFFASSGNIASGVFKLYGIT